MDGNPLEFDVVIEKWEMKQTNPMKNKFISRQHLARGMTTYD